MAAHAPRVGMGELPRPGRAALPFLALALVALGFEADPRSRFFGLVAVVGFALAACVRAGLARAELRAVRRRADRLILAESAELEGSELVRWRCGELVAPGSRRRLAGELEQTLRRLDPARLPSASPLRRGLVRRHADLLRRLEVRMLDGRPVTARGVLLLLRLLREPGSPLYDGEGEGDLVRAIARVLVELEP